MLRIILTFIFLIAAWPVIATAQEGAQQFEGFDLQGYTEGGERAWDVKGDTADILGNTIEIFHVDANRYGEQEMNLKARNGTLDKATGNIHLEKDVVITAKTGGQLRTDSLDWDKEGDLVQTDDYVIITDERMVATGTGLNARPGLKLVKLMEDVTVTVKTDPQNPDDSVLTITCDGSLVIDQAKGFAVFNKNVVAIKGDRTLKADKMEIYFDLEESKMKKVICLGNVEIFQGENKTYSDKAVYTAENQKIVLSGRPKLIMITGGEGGMSSFKK